MSDTRTLARGPKSVTRYETHTHPGDRRRLAVTRGKDGRFQSVVHIATVTDPRKGW